MKIGARGKNLPVGSYYGYATGIVGLRLFPNPDFDEAAAKKWDAGALLHRPELLQRRRIWCGRTASACRAASATSARTRSSRPPIPENPKWENLSSNVGAQYFWIDRIFAWEADQTSFAFQLFHTSRPGTLDTSLVSTDNINNPRTMNAVYSLGRGCMQAKRWGKETLAGGELEQQAVQRLRARTGR